MAIKTNAELWDALRDQNPNFASHTSKATAQLFTDKGYAALKATEPKALNEFFGLTVRAALQLVNISTAKDPLADADFGVTYDTPNGGIVQRMATYSVKPTSPRYKGLTNGSWVNPWTVRKPETSERFFTQNFDYQSFLTLQEFQLKQIFLSDYGMSEYLAGIMEGLRNGYTIQRYTNKLQAIDAGINDTELKPSQTQEVDVSDWNDSTQMTRFLFRVSNTITSMKVSSQTGVFNALGYKSAQDISNMRLLVRAGFSDALRIYTLAGTYNPKELDLPVPVIEVENFGGLSPVKAEDDSTTIYPAYDKDTGEQIGYADTADQTAATYKEGSADVHFKDRNEDVLAVLADKRWLFENVQNPYIVMPTELNPAGLYVNYWASAPNNSICYDRLYNFVVFKKAAAA